MEKIKIKTINGEEKEITINKLSGRILNNLFSSHLKFGKIEEKEPILEFTEKFDSNNQKIYKVIKPASKIIDMEGTNIFELKNKIMEKGISGVSIDEIDFVDFNEIFEKYFEDYLKSGFNLFNSK